MTNTIDNTSTRDSTARPNIGFIGAGALATNLALALSAAGWNVSAVASRSHASAQRLADLIPGCRAETDPQSVVDLCRLIFLTVPDDAISGSGVVPSMAPESCRSSLLRRGNLRRPQLCCFYRCPLRLLPSPPDLHPFDATQRRPQCLCPGTNAGNNLRRRRQKLATTSPGVDGIRPGRSHHPRQNPQIDPSTMPLPS